MKLRATATGSARNWLLALLAFLLFQSPAASALTSSAGGSIPEGGLLAHAYAHVAFIPGEILVGFHPNRLARAGVPPLQPGQVLSPGLSGLSPPISVLGVLPLDLRGSQEHWVGQRVHVAAGQEWAAIQALSADPAVAFAEPNWVVRVTALSEESAPLLPNDPLYLYNQWGLQRIGASRAWALSQGAAVTVAVVDSGVDFRHPEFQGRLLPGRNYLVPGNSAQDDFGHGTHVTGIIAAALENGLGIAGLAPEVIIDPRKVLDDRGFGTIANVAQAIRDAADAGAQIVNLSLESTAPSAALESAVNYAAAKGILLIASAGNRTGRVEWPAAYPAVLAVAATDRFDRHTGYSNQGPEIEIGAPGGMADDPILSTWPGNTFCQGTFLPQSGFCSAIGTSMSAAFVTGAAALVWGMQPNLSPSQVRTILLDTALPLDADPGQVGRGRLDVQAALRRALQSDLQISPDPLTYLLPEGSPPFPATVTLNNPSTDPVSWRAAVTSGAEWLRVAGATSGSVLFGQPGLLRLVVNPMQMRPGTHRGMVDLEGERSNGSQIVFALDVHLQIVSRLEEVFLPTVTGGQPLRWETPGAQGRELLPLVDDSSIGLPLPFQFSMAGRSYDSVRISSKGFLSLPAGTSGAMGPNHCLGNATWPQQAIYGWWTDLAPDDGGQITAFRSLSGAYVVEFAHVPATTSGEDTYPVSFQIALYPDGRIGLNYRQVGPEADAVTVGVEARDGLLYHQLACHTSTVQRGRLPRTGESFILAPLDIR